MSEDALALAPDTMTVNGADTVFTGRQCVGLGELDTERTDVGIFNADVDDIGILGDRPPDLRGPRRAHRRVPAVLPRRWTMGCRSSPGATSAPAVPAATGCSTPRISTATSCSTPPASSEDVFRYVVDLAGDDFYVRDGVTQRDAQGRTATWRLYRIPLRAPTDTIGSPSCGW